jgi:hypothetical protein
LCVLVEGHLRAGDDAEEVAWFAVEELGGLKLAPETERVILKGFDAVRATEG